MSQRPFSPPPSFAPPVSFNLSQRATTPADHHELAQDGAMMENRCRRFAGEPPQSRGKKRKYVEMSDPFTAMEFHNCHAISNKRWYGFFSVYWCASFLKAMKLKFITEWKQQSK
jgi:hypothetical protein